MTQKFKQKNNFLQIPFEANSPDIILMKLILLRQPG
jgi:hypothetical protein